MKVYIVKHVWSYEGCSDNFINCYEESIEKIFDNEGKAIKYIQDKIQKLLNDKYEILSAKEKVNKEECCTEKCKSCIACMDFISLNIMPTEEELIKSHVVEYNEDHMEHSSYMYVIYEVE